MRRLITNFFGGLLQRFRSGQAEQDLKAVQQHMLKAAPYIAIAAEFAAGLTPGAADDATVAFIKSRYPRLFDGSLVARPEEAKLYGLGIAADLLQRANPAISTSIARAAVQLEFTLQRAEQRTPSNVLAAGN